LFLEQGLPEKKKLPRKPQAGKSYTEFNRKKRGNSDLVDTEKQHTASYTRRPQTQSTKEYGESADRIIKDVVTCKMFQEI
jgi:hypothetical protein